MAIFRVTRNPFDAAKLGSYGSNWLDTIVAFRPSGEDEYHYVNPADYIRADSFNGTIDFLPDDDPRIQINYDNHQRPVNVFTRQKIGDVHIIQHIKQGCGGCRNKMKSQKWYDPALYINSRQQPEKLSQNRINDLVKVALIKFETWNKNQ